MGKNDELRRQLKAADRRRGRRPQPVPQAGNNAPPSAARVLDDAILSVIVGIDRSRQGITDRDLRAALQSSLRGTPPRGDAAQVIFRALADVRQSQQPAGRLWRDALNRMLEASRDYDPDDARGRNYLLFLQSVAS